MNKENELERFCEERGFLYHAYGSGQWGRHRYWTYYKVEQGDTLFSIEYFPIAQRVKIRVGPVATKDRSSHCSTCRNYWQPCASTSEFIIHNSKFIIVYCSSVADFGRRL